MAAPDSTTLKALIDSNIPDATPTQQRRATASFLRYTLKAVIDWITTAINTNLYTWLKTADNQPGSSATDSIYRTGLTEFRGGVNSIVRDPSGTLATTGFSTGAIQIQGSDQTRPAYIEFHVRGIVIHQLGVDSDGVLKFRPYATPISYEMLINNYSQQLLFPQVTTNKKIMLYGSLTNDHQFYGFGVNPGVLRYQINSVADAHIFYAGLSPATSQELMRITGNGNVSIGDTTSVFKLKVVDTNPASGYVLALSNARNTAGRTGTKILFDQNSLSGWAIGQPGGDVDGFVIEGNGATERVRINNLGHVGIGTNAPLARLDVSYPAGAYIGLKVSNGNSLLESYIAYSDGKNYFRGFTILADTQTTDFVGIGLTAPTSKLHVKGATGHQQLRLETSYTPTGSADANGAVGQIAWDATYIYVKTAAGWRRAAFGAAW